MLKECYESHWLNQEQIDKQWVSMDFRGSVMKRKRENGKSEKGNYQYEQKDIFPYQNPFKNI